MDLTDMPSRDELEAARPCPPAAGPSPVRGTRRDREHRTHRVVPAHRSCLCTVWGAPARESRRRPGRAGAGPLGDEGQRAGCRGRQASTQAAPATEIAAVTTVARFQPATSPAVGLAATGPAAITATTVTPIAAPT